MLSISAALLVEAFRKVVNVDPGFRPENVITFRVSAPDATYDEPAKKIAYGPRVRLPASSMRTFRSTQSRR